MRVGFLVKSWKYKNFKVIMRPHIVFYPNVYSISTNNIVNFLFSFTFLHFFNLLEMVQSLHNCTWLELTLYSWYPAMIRLFVGHKKELGWQVILLCSTFLLSAHSLLPFFIFTVTNCVEILIFVPEPQKTEDFSFCSLWISFIF